MNDTQDIPSVEEQRLADYDTEDRYAKAGSWQDLLLFGEYFCGDTGRGVGASHQTECTAFISLRREAAHRLRR